MKKVKTSTRDVVLHSIKSMNGATVDQLAEVAGVSPVTVRHHLNGLQAEGLISAEAIRRKVGRPYYVYTVSEAGLELFPKKYFALSNRILDELKDRFSADVVNDLFQSLVQRIIDQHRTQFERLAFEDRLDYLMRLLADEGFMADWKREGDTYLINEFSCPFISIGQQHAEICSLDRALIEAVTNAPIEQHSCMLDGDECCQFTVLPSPKSIPLAEVTIQ